MDPAVLLPFPLHSSPKLDPVLSQIYPAHILSALFL